MSATKPRKWRRRLLWLLALGVAARLALEWSLPTWVELAGPSLGCDVRCRDASLSLLGGRLAVDGLVVHPADRPNGTPLLRCDALFAAVDVWQLLHGELLVEDVRLLGASATLLQRDDGTFVLPGLPPSEPSAQPAPEPTAAAAALDFSPPFRLQRLRALDLSLELRNAAAPDLPPLERWLVDVTADDLGGEGPGKLGLRIHGQDRLDHIECRAVVRLQRDAAQIDWRADARGVRLESRLFDALRRPFDNPGHIADAEWTGTFGLRHGPNGTMLADAKLDGTLALDGTEAATFALRMGPASSDGITGSTPFSLRCDVPALWTSLAIEQGELRLDTGGLAATAALRAEALTLDPLRRFLAEQGVLWPTALDAAMRLSATRTGAGALSVRLQDVTVGTTEDRIGLADLQVRDLTTGDGELAIANIDVDDLAASVTLTADGALRAAGITLRPAPIDAAARPAPNEAPSAPPQLRLGGLRWRGLQLRLRDETLPEPAELAITDWQLLVQDLALAADQQSGNAELRMQIAGAIERCEAKLRLTAAPTATNARLELRTDGITTASLRPWLDRAGLNVYWQAARLQAEAEARLESTGTDRRLAATLRDCVLEDRGNRLFALAEGSGDGTLTTAGFGLGAVSLRGAELALARREDGSLDVAGLLLPGSPTNARAWRLAANGTLGAPRTDGRRATDFDLALPGTVDRAELRGLVAFGSERFGADLSLAATGLRGAGIGALLPPGTECTLQDGALTASLRTDHVSNSGATEFELRDLRLRDGDVDHLHLPNLRLDAARLDADTVHVRELRLAGLDLRTVDSPRGLEALGMRFVAAPAAAAPTTEPTPNAPAPRAAAARLPDLRLDAAVLELAALRRFAADGNPLPTGTLRLELRESWHSGTEPALADPMRWTVKAGAPPLVDDAHAELAVQPFALAPTFSFDFAVGPIDTTRLPEAVPSLASAIAGRATAWRCSGSLYGHLELRRRDPLRFDLDRPFGAYLRVGNLVLADGDEPPFFALPEAEIQVRSFDPRTGALTIQRIDAVQPSLRIRRTTAGIEIGGICLTETPAATPNPAIPAPARPAAPVPESRIEILSVQGLACDLRDDTTKPATHLPIADLDLEIRGASSRMLVEPIPLAVRLDAVGGDVELERRIEHSSLLAGVVGSTAQMVSLRGNRHQQELRPWFEQLTVEVDALLFPVFDGTFRLRLDALEMPALRGLVAPCGVQIADGLLDLRVDGEMRGTIGGVVRGLPVFRHLSITEPPGGPISTYLLLPAPLDTVLFLLRNEDGQHRLPIRIALDDHRLDPATIRDSAIETVALLIGEAVGSTPWRAVTTVTDLLGLRKKVDLAALGREFAFEAGAATPSTADLDAVVRILSDQPDRRVVLRHQATADDLAVAEHRTNPPRDELLRQIERLRAGRAEILAERAPLALDVAARIAAGRGTETWPLQAKLQAVDERLGGLEASLDEALEMLGDDSPSARRRRAGEGLRDLGRARLQAVRQRLLALLGPDAADRIELRAPRPTPKADLDGPGRVELMVR